MPILFVLFAGQNRDRVFRQNASCAQDCAVQKASQLDKVLSEALDMLRTRMVSASASMDGTTEKDRAARHAAGDVSERRWISGMCLAAFVMQ